MLAIVLGGTARVEAGDAEVTLAAQARASVVRIRWRDPRFSRSTAVRNAIVIRRDGMLLMAGPPLPDAGTLTARLADGRELTAERLAVDPQVALTLLRVRAANLPALTLRREAAPVRRTPRDTQGTPKKAPPAKSPASKAGKAPATAPDRASAPPPLAFAPIGLRCVMVTSDGGVAMGPVRSHRRYGTVPDPATRGRVRTTGLLGVTVACVDEDAGAPFLDAQGRVVGLMVGRKAVVAPEKGEAAARVGLRLRPEPREAVAVPASVVALAWPLLERFRRVPRAALGVRTLQMDDVLRAQLDLDTGGHVVRGIEPESPAAREGLKLHDVIVGVDGRRIEPGTSLHDVLLPYRPGATVKLDVFRAGDRVSLALRLEERR